MKLYIVLCLLVLGLEARKCPGIYFNSRYFDIEILKEGVNRMKEMVLDTKENVLYFIFEQIDQIPINGLGFMELNTRHASIIVGIRNATSITIDSVYNVIYVGASDGVYRLNNKEPEMLPIRDNIQHVFFKDILYYTNMRNEAFIYHNGYIDRLYELSGVAVNKLVLDDDENIFFTRGKTLYRIKLGGRTVNRHDSYGVDTLAVDSYYKPYISTNTGIYVYNKYKYVFDKVSDLRNLRGLTFTKNNEPIFCILDSIYKLTFNAEKCFDTNVK